MDSSRRLASLRLVCLLFTFCGEFLCHGFVEFLASRDDVLMDAAKRYRVDTENAAKSRGQRIRRKTRQENNQGEGSLGSSLSRSILDFWRSAN